MRARRSARVDGRIGRFIKRFEPRTDVTQHRNPTSVRSIAMQLTHIAAEHPHRGGGYTTSLAGAIDNDSRMSEPRGIVNRKDCKREK